MALDFICKYSRTVEDPHHPTTDVESSYAERKTDKPMLFGFLVGGEILMSISRWQKGIIRAAHPIAPTMRNEALDDDYSISCA